MILEMIEKSKSQSIKSELEKPPKLNNFDDYERDTQGSINSDLVKLSSQKMASSATKPSTNCLSKIPNIQSFESQNEVNLDLVDMFQTSSNNQGLGVLDEQGTLKTTSSDSKNGKQINPDLNAETNQNIPLVSKKPSKYETLDEFFATDVQLQNVDKNVVSSNQNTEVVAAVSKTTSEPKKTENKQFNFNFDELDDMGEVLDFDLDENTDENAVLSNYFGSQQKNQCKQGYEQNENIQVKKFTENSQRKESIVSEQLGNGQLENYFGKNYGFDESKCQTAGYDSLNIDLKKTKSQNLNFSELGFSNSRSFQNLNHHQKDQILLQLLRERGSFQEKLRLAESEIMDKEYHIECMMKGGNVIPLDMTQARLHLAFLFSSPLIRRTNSSIENIMQLDYLTEIDDILKVCSRRKYEMKYKIDVATVSNLRSTITDCPVALHFSGHGIENTPENLGSEYAIFRGRGNILLLEDEHGMADYFFEEDLKHMIEMSKNTFEVVFVSS